MMMALGLFVFALETLPYQNFQHQMAWRHPANNRTGQRPARQFLGPDDETITLSGVLAPELTGGDLTLSMLRMMADLGTGWTLIEGTGTYYGMFVVEDLSLTRTIFFSDGKARRIEFSLKLARVDDDAVWQAAGALLGVAGDLLTAAGGLLDEASDLVVGLLP